MLEDLYDRIAEIAETMRRARDREIGTHVLIGAGCSKSAGIPLASELISEIRDKYPARCRDLPESTKNLYGLCMSQLLGNERRDLINPHIQRAKMNWAHIALAQMMKMGFVDRVLTVNFDSLIQQSCTLVGLQPAIYDFGAAPFDEFSRLVDPSVIYLHGQSYGFVILNTDEETEQHGRKLIPVLRDTLNRAPLLAVGYSGNADGIFSVIEREYARREAFYWVGSGECPAHANRFFEDHNHRHCRYVGGADADFFLFKLAEALGCWPPKIFANPVEHILELIEPIIPFPLDTDAPKGHDILAKTRRDLAVLKAEFERRKTPSIESTILTGTSSDVAKLAPTTTAGRKKLSKSERAVLAAALIGEGRKIAAQAAMASDSDRVPILDTALDKFREAIRIQRDSISAKGALMRHLIERGRLTPTDQSSKYYQEAISQAVKSEARGATNAVIYQNWCWALIDLSQQTPGEDGLRLLREAVERGAKATQVDPKSAACFSAWCWALIDLGRRTPSEDGVRLLQEAVERGTKAAEIDQKSSGAFSAWAWALIDLARRTPGENCIRLLREAVEHGAKAAEIDQKGFHAFSAWCWGLIELGRRTAGENGARLLREAVERTAQAARIGQNNSGAFTAWAWALIDLSRRTPGEDGIRLLREAVERSTKAAEIGKRTPSAYSAWCWALIDLGRRSPGDDGVALLREAVERGARAAKIDQKSSYAFSNWCWTLIELGRRISGESGVRFLREAVKRGAQAAEIDQNSHALSAWCSALIEIGRRTPGEHGIRLLREAFECGKKANDLDPFHWEAFTNCGVVSLELGRRLDNHQMIADARKDLDRGLSIHNTSAAAHRYIGSCILLEVSQQAPALRKASIEEAIDFFANAEKLRTGVIDGLCAWARAIMKLATEEPQPNSDLTNILVRADQKLKEVESIYPDRTAYERAIFAAISNDEIGCRHHLKDALKNGQIPIAMDLANDLDFRRFNDAAWFKDIASRVPK
jgi:tetratricopeptide (TPR) repeat protein